MAKKKITISKSEYDYLYEQAVKMVYVETITEAIKNKTTLINELATIDQPGLEKNADRVSKVILNGLKSTRETLAKVNLIPQVIDGKYYLIPHNDIKINISGNHKYPADYIAFRVTPMDNQINGKKELKVTHLVTIGVDGKVSDYQIKPSDLENINPKINILNRLYWDSFDEIGYDIFEKSGEIKPDPADKDRKSPITQEEIDTYNLAKQEAEIKSDELEPTKDVKPTSKKSTKAKQQTAAYKKRQAELEREAERIEQEILNGGGSQESLESIEAEVEDAKKKVRKAKKQEEIVKQAEEETPKTNVNDKGQFSMFGDEDSQEDEIENEEEDEIEIVDDEVPTETKDKSIEDKDFIDLLKKQGKAIDRANKSLSGKETAANARKLDIELDKWDNLFGGYTFGGSEIPNSRDIKDSIGAALKDHKLFLDLMLHGDDENDSLEDDPQGNNAEIKRVMDSYNAVKQKLSQAQAEFDQYDQKVLDEKATKEDIEKRNIAKDKVDSYKAELEQLQPTVDVIRNVLKSPLADDRDESGDEEFEEEGEVEVFDNEYFTLKEINAKIKNTNKSLANARKALEADPRSNANKKSVQQLESRLNKLSEMQTRIREGQKLKKSEKAKTSQETITAEETPVEEIPVDEVPAEETPEYEEETATEYARKKDLADYNPELATADGWNGKTKDLSGRENGDYIALSKFLEKGPSVFIKRKLNDGTFEIIPKKIVKQAKDGYEGAELYYDSSSTRRAPIIKMALNDEGNLSPTGIFLVTGDNASSKRKSKPIALTDSTVKKLIDDHEWLGNTSIEQFEEDQVSDKEVPVIKGAPKTPIEDVNTTDGEDETTTTELGDGETKTEDLGTEESVESLGAETKTRATKSMDDFDNGIIAKVINYIEKNGLKGPQEIDGDVLSVKVGEFQLNKIKYSIFFNYYKEGEYYSLDYVDVVDKGGASIFHAQENKIHSIATETIKNKIKGIIPFDFEVIGEKELGENGVFKGKIINTKNPFNPESGDEGDGDFREDPKTHNAPATQEIGQFINLINRLGTNVNSIPLKHYFGEYTGGVFKMELQKNIKISGIDNTLIIIYSVDEEDPRFLKFKDFELLGGNIVEKFIKSNEQYDLVKKEFVKGLGSRSVLDTHKGDFEDMVKASQGKASKGELSTRTKTEPGVQDNPKKNEMSVLLADKVEGAMKPKNMRYFLIDGDNRIKLFNDADKGVGIVYDKQEDGSYLATRITVDALDISNEIELEAAKHLKDWRKLSGESMMNFIQSAPKIDVDAEDTEFEPISDEEPQHQEPEEEPQQEPLKPLKPLEPEEEEYIEDVIEDMEEAIPHIDDTPGLRDKINAKVNQLLQKYSKGRLGNGMTKDLIRIASKVGKTTGKGYSMGKNMAKATAYNTAKVGQAFSQGFSQGRDAEDERNYDKDHNKYFRRMGDDMKRIGNDSLRRTKKTFKQIGEDQDNKFKLDRLNEIKARTTRRGRNQ